MFIGDDPRTRVGSGEEQEDIRTVAPATDIPSVLAVIPNPSVRTRFVARVKEGE